jgi:hypothetical protein
MARRVAWLPLIVALIFASPSEAHTIAVADATAAVGFAGGSPPSVARSCTGSITVVPAVTVTTLPPSVDAHHVALARSTCAGNLPGGTRYLGHASYITIDLWRDGEVFSTTVCFGQDECSVTLPISGASGAVMVGTVFHWSLADGEWNIEEPGACFEDGDPTAVWCVAQTLAHF